MSQLQLCGTTYSYRWIRDHFEATSTSYSDQTLNFCQQWLRGTTEFTITTSGSTGKPKPITLQREQMVASAHATAQAIDLQTGQHALVCLNTAYIAGLMMLVRSFELGLRMTIVEPSRRPVAQVANPQYDFTAMVPMQVAASLEHDKEQFERLSTVLIGGAPIDKTLQDAIMPLRPAIYHTYGMTETVTHIALRRLNGVNASDRFVPLPTVELGLDARGCLTICAPMTLGKTIVTNDRVELLADGSFRWLGRIDNVINSGGIKIQAEKVERALATHFPHQRLFVYGQSDALLGERVVAIVEGEAQSIPTDFPELDRYEVPRSVHFLAQFAETETGKIDRQTTIARIKS